MQQRFQANNKLLREFSCGWVYFLPLAGTGVLLAGSLTAASQVLLLFSPTNPSGFCFSNHDLRPLNCSSASPEQRGPSSFLPSFRMARGEGSCISQPDNPTLNHKSPFQGQRCPQGNLSSIHLLEGSTQRPQCKQSYHKTPEQNKNLKQKHVGRRKLPRSTGLRLVSAGLLPLFFCSLPPAPLNKRKFVVRLKHFLGLVRVPPCFLFLYSPPCTNKAKTNWHHLR